MNGINQIGKQYAPKRESEEVMSVDTSRVKVYSLGACAVLSAALLGYFLSVSFLDVENNLRGFIYALVAGVLFLSFMLLQVFFVKGERVITAMIVLSSAAFTTPFFIWYEMSSLIFLGFVLMTGILWVAVKRGRYELDNQLRIRFFHVERFVVPTALTAISVFLGLVYVSTVSFEGGGLSKENFLSLVSPVEPAVSNYIPNFTLEMTVAELAESLAANQLGERWDSLTRAQKDIAASQAVGQLREQLAGYGISGFRNNDAVGDVFYGYAMAQLERIPEVFRTLIPFGLLILAFLTIRGLAILLRWFVSVPAYLMYELAFATGFATTALEAKSREVILLK